MATLKRLDKQIMHLINLEIKNDIDHITNINCIEELSELEKIVYIVEQYGSIEKFINVSDNKIGNTMHLKRGKQ